MLHSFEIATDRAIAGIDRLVPAKRFTAVGRGIALVGIVLPLFQVEVLKPLISNTPWLAWLYPAFGEARAAALRGMAEAKRELR
jgi:hypothetical protein